LSYLIGLTYDGFKGVVPMSSGSTSVDEQRGNSKMGQDVQFLGNLPWTRIEWTGFDVNQEWN